MKRVSVRGCLINGSESLVFYLSLFMVVSLVSSNNRLQGPNRTLKRWR